MAVDGEMASDWYGHMCIVVFDVVKLYELHRNINFL
jgi:hypothetical protein